MLKKCVLKRLLPLLFSFCCVFSGFLSVDAFASSIVIDMTEAYELNHNTWFGLYHGNYFNDNGTPTGQGGGLLGKKLTTTAGVPYPVGNTTAYTNCTWINFMCSSDTYPILNDVYDYYLYGSLISNKNFTFSPDKLIVTYFDTTSKVYEYTDFTVSTFTNEQVQGIQFYCNLNMSTQNAINVILLNDSNGGVIGTNLSVWYRLIPIPKDASSEQVQSIISAINNQTTTLDGSIGQAADDIQQSIEDQYSGDPEAEFAVDDVITQHNEKMGVLSFGSDVMLQFLDMFQSANVGTAELTLPGFNITVENVEYAVWPDYSFNFEQLNEWVPALMSVIRVMLPTFVWLMVLRYCIKVFEDNFLSK